MEVLVRDGRFRLAEVLGQLPGVRYSAAAQGIQQFGSAMQRDLERTRFVARYRHPLSQISND